jgi:site-specific recombinase XerD
VNQDTQPYAFRRHLKECQFYGVGGRRINSNACNCPIHADGKYYGERLRQSLNTRNMRTAERRLAALLRKIDDKHETGVQSADTTSKIRTTQDAADRFLRSHGVVDREGRYTKFDIEFSSYRKYRTKLTLFSAFCDRDGIEDLEDVNLDVLEDYRRTRNISAVTWKVELQALRTFFAYCLQHKWIANNPAREMRSPRNLKPNEIVPYTLDEEAKILAACDRIGGAKYKRSVAVYERLRAKAMVLLLRHTALRISDVAALKKETVTWDVDCKRWPVFVRTQKSGEPVYLPIPTSVKMALDLVPLPRNAAQDCTYYFWNGATSRRAVIGIAERSLAAVFKNSGVKNAHAHRYWHTLATRLLEDGASFQEVADVLGNTEAVVRKHYGKWSKQRQFRLDQLMTAHFQSAEKRAKVTHESHENLEPVN